jgi:tripartite-type tricarboxylate transporter receptor subunit TctC
MPAPLTERLRAATRSALQSATLREKFANQGAEPTDPSPAALEELMRADLARWSKLVREANLKVD